MPRVENGQNPATGLGGLDSLKAAKLAEINAAFEEAEKNGHVLLSLGFEVDANETANRNVEGLIKVLSARGISETYFCDYNNTMQAVTLEQLKTMQLEIIGYGQELYGKKWALRDAVNNATTADEVNAVCW